MSFGSYFNAFPASYWRRWTVVEDVVLRVRVEGECTIIVYRSTAKGASHPVESIVVDSDGPETVEFKLPLSQFIDGGWYWFDIAAASRGVTLIEADWATRTDRLTHGRFSIAMTTFNRPDYCLDNLRVLGEAPDVLDVLDHVYVADQGTNHVEDQDDFTDATKGLGTKLRIIEQGNIGGSGGFSRGMDETVREGSSDYVLVLDDDVVTEPESMLRAITFADLARRPTIVGGHMFSMYDRSVLHSFGETIARYNWWWGAAPRTVHEHDFGRRNLRNTPWLHRRVDVDYNGWWMCLIPTSVVRKLGLSLPVFIKWDDAEYGLRAKAAGVPVVSMPGVAVWHVPWQDKNDALDWQAYFHLRNRLVTALLHSPYPRGGSVVSENMEYQIRHLLSMQYSTARLRLLAIEDVLAGPEHMHNDILTKMGQLREVRKDFADSQSRPDIEAFPDVKRLKPPKRGKEPTSPTNKIGLLVKAALGAVRQVLPVSELSKEHPAMVVPSQDAQWWLLSNTDGALVSSADGTTTSWYQRDPELFRTLMTAERRAARPAVARVAEAAQALHRRRARLHLARPLARDLRSLRPQGLSPLARHRRAQLCPAPAPLCPAPTRESARSACIRGDKAVSVRYRRLLDAGGLGSGGEAGFGLAPQRLAVDVERVPRLRRAEPVQDAGVLDEFVARVGVPVARHRVRLAARVHVQHALVVEAEPLDQRQVVAGEPVGAHPRQVEHHDPGVEVAEVERVQRRESLHQLARAIDAHLGRRAPVRDVAAAAERMALVARRERAVAEVEVEQLGEVGLAQRVEVVMDDLVDVGQQIGQQQPVHRGDGDVLEHVRDVAVVGVVGRQPDERHGREQLRHTVRSRAGRGRGTARTRGSAGWPA